MSSVYIESSASLPASMSLRYTIGSIVVPGDRLCNKSDSGSNVKVEAGSGTHYHSKFIHASIVGKLRILQRNDTCYEVQIVKQGNSTLAKHAVLHIGQVVLAKVTRITLQQANVEILSTTASSNTTEDPVSAILYTYNPNVEGYPEGVINKADIYGPLVVDKDDTIGKEIYDCFNVNDLVLCQILSLGDSRRYYLTTGHPYLGVLPSLDNINTIQRESSDKKKYAKPRQL